MTRNNNSSFQFGTRGLNANRNLLDALNQPETNWNGENLLRPPETYQYGGEPMDIENTLVWAKARMSNFGTKMAELNYDIPVREYESFVKAYLSENKGASKDELNREFLFQAQKMLSDENVQKMIEKLEEEIFFVPSSEFKAYFGRDSKEKIVRSVAMKEPILYREIQSRNGQQNFLFKEVEYIHQNIWPWGTYLIDLNKFEKYANDKFAQKSGVSTDKVFELPFYDLEFRIKDKIITVKHKNTEIGPEDLATVHMRTMAVDRIKSKIQSLIESFAKYTKKKMESNYDLI